MDHTKVPQYKLELDEDGQVYNDCEGLRDFLNENAEFYQQLNTTGNILVIDDQFVNQQGIRLNFMDLGLADRVVILSNGGEALSFFESFFECL